MATCWPRPPVQFCFVLILQRLELLLAHVSLLRLINCASFSVFLDTVPEDNSAASLPL